MSKTLNSFPRFDGYRMPGEFELHTGTWMLWPERTDTWRLGAKPAQQAFANVAKAISQFEPVTICVSAKQYEHARSILPSSIRIVEMSSNDAWMRDIGPIFVINDQEGIRGIDWGFNAWGGIDEGLYFPWDLDSQVKQKVLDIERIDRYDAQDFILEGGAITVDGEGTLITTEQCVLNPNRNPNMLKAEIEKKLSDYLNIDKVIWLKNGMVNDETDGHVDEVVFFARPGEVVMSWTDDINDPNYTVLQDAYKQLSNTQDAKGRKLKIHKIPLPTQQAMSAEESAGIDFAIDSYQRMEGLTFASSYVNCYLCNGGLILPAFDDPQDTVALGMFQKIFPDREIIQVQTREISFGGGNIHCITQQQPKP
ncbi:agmatine deiminase [Ornithinibacillus sp. 4-3]|uniref:Putative agmatine deiminase n=1 Tax=Ornithinibacillus sp. 4-3 TaxID=3231488 RepID=A0AB39HLI5_9BACI